MSWGYGICPNCSEHFQNIVFGAIHSFILMSLRIFFEEIKNFYVLNKIKDADMFMVAKSLVNVQSIVKFIQ